jgi:hypothetical protein
MLVATPYESHIRRSHHLNQVWLLPATTTGLAPDIPALIPVQTSFLRNANPALDDATSRALDGEAYAPRLIIPVSPRVFDNGLILEMKNRRVLSQLRHVREDVLEGLSKCIAIDDKTFREPHEKLCSHR